MVGNKNSFPERAGGQETDKRTVREAGRTVTHGREMKHNPRMKEGEMKERQIKKKTKQHKTSNMSVHRGQTEGDGDYND